MSAFNCILDNTFLSPTGWRKVILFLFIVSALRANLIAADEISQLSDLSIEQLMSRKVVTANRSEQNLSDTAAAVFVISQEDIRRSGVNSIPEALRLAPGLHVARIDANKWAVTARGFNGRFANNLLVLMDGRTLYVPSSSGVYWEVQDRIIEDIERIEIIRGPGASVWGANAVNGIINIITKNSTNTEGGLLTAVGGDRSGAGGRYGWQFSDEGYARVYAKYFRQDGFEDQQGNNNGDDWHMSRGGFRLDWTPSADHNLMTQADIYDGGIDETFIAQSVNSLAKPVVQDNAQTKGGNILARWQYSQSLASRFTTQVYYDHFRREDQFKNERIHVADFDFQHELALPHDNEFTWGMNYRFSSTQFKETAFVSVSPNNRQLHLIGGFVQDKIDLFNNRLQLTAGTKLEYHSQSGFQYQPSFRLLWKLSQQHRFWASVSRAVRVPSIAERHTTIQFGRISPAHPFAVLNGSTNFDAETVLSYEAGYRFWLSDAFYFDIAGFYNDYDELIFVEPGAPTPFGTIPITIINGEKAKTWGVEFTADWRPVDWLRVQANYSYLDMSFKQLNPQFFETFPTGNRRDPKNQASLRSSIDLPYAVELDIWLRYVDSIADIEVFPSPDLPEVDNYFAVDVRLGWKPHPDIELSVVGRNLNDPQHLEYLNETAGTFAVQIERRFYVQGKWTF
ncbi:MAG: TonB-dependent receptor [Gammaproteobacteria bacterium]|nr:TonB-dependent receptor [Gammaproteobacteria bacterium]